MILTIIGLSSSFIGSAMLIYYALTSFGKEKTYVAPCSWNKNGKPIEYMRQKKVYGINDGWGGYKEVKISIEEIILFISLFLISCGFLLQILDFIF